MLHFTSSFWLSSSASVFIIKRVKTSSIKSSNWCTCNFDLTFFRLNHFTQTPAKNKAFHFLSRPQHTSLKAIGYALPLFIGPSKGKKSFVPFLAKAVLAFYTISRSCSCTCFTEYKELNLDALVVNRWSYIIISEKSRFLEQFLLSNHLLLLLSPFLLHPKNLADNPKKFRVFTFSRCWRDICVACESVLRYSPFSLSAEKSFL